MMVVEFAFKEREKYQEVRIGGLWGVFRLDGVGFSRLSSALSLKTNDPSLHSAIVGSVEEVMRGSTFKVPVAFVGSDEVSLLIIYPPYRGRIEKIESVLAGVLSSKVTLKLNAEAPFDCRYVEVLDVFELVSYILERMESVRRNAVLRTAQRVLGKKSIEGLRTADLLKKLGEKGVEIPDWALYGTLLIKEGRTLRRVNGRVFWKNPAHLREKLREAVRLSVAGTYREGEILRLFLKEKKSKKVSVR